MPYKVNKGPQRTEALRRMQQQAQNQEPPRSSNQGLAEAENSIIPAYQSNAAQNGYGDYQGQANASGQGNGNGYPSQAPANAQNGYGDYQGQANASGQSNGNNGNGYPSQTDDTADPVAALLQEAGLSPELNAIQEGMPTWEFGTGYLAVNVTTGRGLLPVAGAVVTVTSKQVLDQLVWARAITDSSGQIQPVPLPAPSKQLSQNPDTPQRLTYGSYNVYVQARNMLPNLRENIQVFDGVTSIQNIELTMRSAGGPDELLDSSDVGEIYDL